MRGSAHSYVDLAGVAGLGDLLLNVRPALVFAADGARLLWANAAGAALLGETEMGALLRREITPLNPLREQAARLARLVPAASSRIEILRIGNGLALSLVPAACRRLNLADGTRALLAVALDPVGLAAGASLTARAERLVATLSTGDCVAAVIDAATGRIVAAADGFEAVVASEPGLGSLIDDARRAGDGVRKATAGHQRAVGAAGFTDSGRRLALVIVGPPGQAASALPAPVEISSAVPDTALDVGELPVEMMLPLLDDALPEDEVPDPDAAVAIEPPIPAAPPLAPVIRFAWATGPDGRFAAGADELSDAVGPDFGAIAGLTWTQVAGALAIDAEGRVGRAFADGEPFSATVYWPDAAAGDCVAVDLTGLPVRDRDGSRSGFHGFGVLRSDDRRPDTRAARTALPSAPPPATPEQAPEPPELLSDNPTTPASAPSTATDDAETQDADRAAQLSIEAGGRPDDGVSNVVRLPGTPVRALPAPLSGVENDAFRRIAEALGSRRDRPAPPDTPPASAPPEVATPPEATLEPPPPVPAEIDGRLLDRLPVGIAIVRDRRTLFANRAFLDLLGYETAEAFDTAGGADTLFPGRERLTGTLPELGGSLRARRNDGSTTSVRAWLHAVGFGGATALMLSLMPAEERPAEREEDLAAALARSEARAGELAAILDTATDGVIVIDARGKIRSVNHAAEALFGIEGAQYAGRFFTDLLADESQKAALDYLDGLASNGVASVLNDGREVIGRVPQGGLIPLFMTMGRIGTSDTFAAVLRDITHWKNVEEELTAARRAAEAANQQKSDFLAKISHEIRTPLNAIIGFSEVMMSERFGPIGNPRYRDYLHDIHVSGGHLMSLINDLLDLSKIEAGKLDLSFEAVPVNAVIQETVALMQPQANRERIIIRTSLSTEVPNVVADPRSFRQILLNLLSNAIKFTRAGGQVIVSTTLETSGEVVVRIRDTGIGMTPRDLETAMKPFRQVATSRDDRDQGTGLGLPLTKALVEANRATFAIESAPNEGTLVKVIFPTTRVLAG